MTLNFLAFYVIPSTFTSNDVKQTDEMTMLPYSGVGAWAPGYPARKREDLVRLGFPTCNLSNIAIM
jgi:hypothetical protein